MPNLRKLDQYFGAQAARSRADTHRSAIKLRDLVDDGEPQAAAVSGGVRQSKEPLPSPLALRLRNARAGVFYGQVRRPSPCPCADGDAASRWGVLQGVVHQIA